MSATKLKLKQVAVTENFDFGGFVLGNLAAPAAANDAVRKAYVDQEVAKVAGAMTYKGTWDAALNQPAIPAADASNKGHYYVVAVAGATAVDGVSDWEQRDWIVSNGTAWEKIDNTDKVISIFGRTGDVTAEAGDYNAGQITFTPAGSLQATDVQGALAEVDGDVTALAGRVTTAEGEIDTLQSDVLALGGRLDVVEPALSQAQSDIIALDGRLDTVEADLPNKLNKALAAGQIFVGNGSGEAAAARYVVREAAAADGAFTVYTLAYTPVAGTEQVFVNGLLMEPGEGNDYAISGAAITFPAALSGSDKVRVSYIALA